MWGQSMNGQSYPGYAACDTLCICQVLYLYLLSGPGNICEQCAPIYEAVSPRLEFVGHQHQAEYCLCTTE